MPSLPACIVYLGQLREPLIEGSPPPTKHRLAAEMLHSSFFLVLTTVTASAIFSREADGKEQEIDCCSPSCHITKGTAQWGVCRKPQGREIRELREGTWALEIHTPPVHLWESERKHLNADLPQYAWALEKFGFLSECCNMKLVLVSM